MAKKTVDSQAKFTKEMTGLTIPGAETVRFKVMKDIARFFANAAAKEIKVFVEIHYDTATKVVSEIKSRLGENGSFITQWP